MNKNWKKLDDDQKSEDSLNVDDILNEIDDDIDDDQDDDLKDIKGFNIDNALQSENQKFQHLERKQSDNTFNFGFDADFDPSELFQTNEKSKSNQVNLSPIMKEVAHYDLIENEVNGIIQELEEEENFEKEYNQVNTVRNTVPTERDFINPLDILEHEEEQQINYKENQQQFEKNLILDKIKIEHQKNMDYKVNEAITKKIYQQSDSSFTYGIPRCLHVVEGQFYFIGTSFSVILIFNYNQNTFNQIMGDKSEFQQYGSVVSIDVNSSSDALVAGYEYGDLILWDFIKQTQIKVLKNICETSIIQVKFYGKDKYNIVISDALGNDFLVNIKWVWWSYTFDHKRLLQKSTQIIHDIEILKYENKAYKNGNIQIAALAGIDVVMILTLLPNVRNIHRFERPKQVKSGSLPCISWGQFSTDSPEPPIFCLSWGVIIQIFRFKIDFISHILENIEEIQFFDLISYLIIDHSNVYCKFISADMLISLNTRKEIRIYHAQSFNQDNFEEINKEQLVDMNQKFLSSIKHQQIVDSDIQFQAYVKDQQNNIRMTYINTIQTIDQFNYNIYIMGQKQLYKGHLYRWSESIKYLIDNNYWNDALKLALQHYQGGVYSFSSKPNLKNEKNIEDYKQITQNLVRVYLECTQKKIRICQDDGLGDNMDLMWKQLAITCIEFVIGIDDLDLLFNECRDFFSANQHAELFYSNMEYFIMQNQIKKIPNQVFQEIVNFFIKENKYSVVQNLIINLDIQWIDTGFAIQLCLEAQLYTPLIYLCTRNDNDFITPLFKMFSAYQQYQTLNPLKANKFIYKCMWFIRSTLNGQMFPNEKIEDIKYPGILKQLVVWLLTDEIIRVFAIVDYQILFSEIIIKFFNDKPSNYLYAYDRDLYGYFIPSDNDLNESQKQQKFQQGESFHNRILIAISNSLQEEMKNNHEILINFNLLVGKIAALQTIKIDFNICFQCVKSLLQDKDDAQKSEHIIYILQLQQKQFVRDKNILNELIKISQNTNHDEIEAYLTYMEGDFMGAYNRYIYLSTLKQHKFKIFRWLDTAFKNFKDNDEKNYLVLQNYVVQNFRELILISVASAKNILLNHLEDKLAQIEENLINFPTILLEFVESYVEERKKGKIIDDETLLLYISLLCQLQPDKVVNELKKKEYPVDQVLLICKKNNAYEAQAYLCEKQGHYQEAFDFYLQIFNTVAKNSIEKVRKNKIANLDLIQTKFQQLINVCKLSAEGEQSQKLWFVLAEKLLSTTHKDSFWDELAKLSDSNQDNAKNLVTSFSDIIAELFMQVSMNGEVDDFCKMVDMFYNQMKIKDFKNSFIKVLTSHNQDLKIVQEANNMVESDYVDVSQKFFLKSLKGLPYSAVCQACGIMFSKQDNIKVCGFSCGHSLHKKCLTKKQCEICQKDDRPIVDRFVISIEQNINRLRNNQSIQNSADQSFQERNSPDELDKGMSRSHSNANLDVEQIKQDTRDKSLRKLKAYDDANDEYLKEFDQIQNKFGIMLT